jgi:RNA polymerase sigma-70 factor (ECF subfamily)
VSSSFEAADALQTSETAIRYSELQTVEALRRGDAEAFGRLVEGLHPTLIRHARLYVSGPVAEEIVQDTWEAVVNSIDRFAQRSSLKTWIFRILLNTIRTRAPREARIVPFTALGSEAGTHAPSVDPNRLFHDDLGAGYWPAAPPRWETQPEAQLLSGEVRRAVELAVAGLPSAQREVMTLRDIEGWSAAEVCEALGISDANARVILHRARATVRRALEVYFDER